MFVLARVSFLCVFVFFVCFRCVRYSISLFSVVSVTAVDCQTHFRSDLLCIKWDAKPTNSAQLVHKNLRWCFFTESSCSRDADADVLAGELEYQAQSPDEGALVSAARNFGFVFRV